MITVYVCRIRRLYIVGVSAPREVLCYKLELEVSELNRLYCNIIYLFVLIYVIFIF